MHAVTPAKGMLVGGYWLGVYVENPAVARHVPHGDSYFDGTDIVAVAPGRTKAYYINAAVLGGDSIADDVVQGRQWFWIDVLESTTP
jgi:hypothetical protein